MDTYHVSVLLQQTIDNLAIQSGKQYIDATLGGGGHTKEILKRGGKVLGIDADSDAISYVEETIIDKNLILAKANFKEIEELANKNGFEKVAGILFDLGVSSHQLEQAERGFSFSKEGPLDMRMDRDLNVKALDLINGLSKGELHELFTRFGEERFAKLLASSIVKARAVRPITTTTELATIVKNAVYLKGKDIHPATRIFQALRIIVNDELNSLIEALPKALALLDNGGRIAVISFHSLEDRIVKQQFKAWEDKREGHILTKKPIVATEEEIEQNKRQRSAKLRVFEKNI